MFEAGEARTCPECGLRLAPLSKLGPSYDAELLDPSEPIPPYLETLPWTFIGRGRGLLVSLAVLGLASFFAPWVHETAPELRTLSGFDLARKLGWIWASGVAYFVMIPLVLTRRSIARMRGARLAVAFLTIIALLAVVMRLVAPPPPASALRPVRFSWGAGLYASGIISLCSLLAAARFGGKLDDLPTQERRRGDETLH